MAEREEPSGNGPRGPVVLCVLDGWGLAPDGPGNAVSRARTPVFDALMADCPNATLRTHGHDVGLPEGQMGNSEVGHMNIGAGRVVWQDLPRIDRAIAEGSFRTSPALNDFAAKVRAAGGRAHLLGLMSRGGVHGHLAHAGAAAAALSGMGCEVVVHALTDGRDVAPGSAPADLAALAAELPEGARIATVCGRYWAMDRDRRWDRVARAYRAIVLGQAEHAADDPAAALAAATARGEGDEFVCPTIIGPPDPIRDGDGLFCLNFRADRAREILSAIAAPDFDAFETGKRPVLSAGLGMISYSEALAPLFPPVFEREALANTLGAWVAGRGLRQFRLAETEKYPHVTFFLNGGREEPHPGEGRHMPASPKVATYDLAPEMAASEVAARLVAAIEEGHDLIVVNFANPDMVGHTGDVAAAIRACEAVDAGLGRALEALRRAGGAMLVTADHGNCETMIDPETGGPHTAHTTNPVPVILVGGPPGARLREGRLADVAPTLLGLMGLPVPPEMTGESLIRA